MDLKKEKNDSLKLDRLTVRNENGGIDRVCHYPKMIQNMSCFSCFDRAKCNADIFERLAQYEDTGLPPAAVEEYKKFEDFLICNGISIKEVIELIHKELEDKKYEKNGNA